MGAIDLTTAQQVFEAGRVIGDAPALLAALTAFESDAAPKIALVSELFGSSLNPAALSLLQGLVASRWSSSHDLLAGIEYLGIRLAAASPGAAQIDEELFAFSRVVASDHELELALGSKLSPVDAKVAVATQLLVNAHPATRLIVTHLLRQPRGRRIGEMLRHAGELAADQNGFLVATVQSAQRLDAAAAKRLQQSLQARYDRDVRLDVVVEPAVLGGLKVQIGDDVIDGTIAARLGELRLKLVG